MSAFIKFDPRAYRASGSAKAANPAKAGGVDADLSRFSSFSTGRPDLAQTNIGDEGQRQGSSWSPEDWQAYFDERAGIAEFEGGLARDAAEARAFECSVCEWLNRDPAPSRPGQCAWCGKAGSAGATILPFGIEPSGHTWLHDTCWADWHRARRAQAIAALSAMGIKAPVAIPDDLERVGDV